MTSTKNAGRLLGLLWFLTAATGGFGLIYIRSRIIVPDDAAATAAHIVANEFSYRAAIVSSLISQLFLFFLALGFFHLFRGVNQRLATVLVASGLVTVSIAVINTFNHFGALLLLSQANFLKAFPPEQLQAMAFVFLRLANSTGQGLIEIFWAPYYISIGLLVLRSKFVPRMIGILLIAMGVGFAINILQKFLIPQFHPALFTRLAMTGGALGGLPTMVWLLIKGVRVEKLEGVAS